MKPKVSVIVPVYKVEPYLRKCLDSLVNQTLRDIEIIVIDDGSPDHCGAICDEYAAMDERIQVVHKENGGLSAARNEGIDRATGEYITFVDSDDWCELDMYETAYAAAKKHDADILIFDAFENHEDHVHIRQYCDHEFVLNDRSVIELIQLSVLTPNLPLKYGFRLTVTQGSPWDKLYRAELFQHADLRFTTNVKAHEDVIFNLYAFTYADRCAYIQAPFYHYRILSTSIMNKYNPNRVEVDRKIYYEFERFKATHAVHADFDRAVRGRVLTMFNQCGYRYFFHEQNPDRFSKRLKRVKQAIREEPYCLAFADAGKDYLNRKQALVLPLARARFAFGLWVLNRLDRVLKKGKKN